jgi:2-phosphoglycolate phosphatase
MKKLIVYDLDGTLIDSAKNIIELINKIRKDLKKCNLDKEKLIPWISVGGESMIKNMLEITDDEVLYFLNKFRKDYYETKTSIQTLYPEVEKTLKTLSLNYYLAICTNKPRLLAEKVMKETKIDKHFSFMCAGDDLKTKKPHKNNLINCIDFFSVESEEVMLVGDSSIDQILAKSCQVDFVHYTQGYNDGVKKSNSMKIINNHYEILKIITK